jgi:hypothetical protein
MIIVSTRVHPARIVGLEYEYEYEEGEYENEEGGCLSEISPEGLAFRLIYRLLSSGDLYFAPAISDFALDQLDEGFPEISSRLMRDPYSALGLEGKVRIWHFTSSFSSSSG